MVKFKLKIQSNGDIKVFKNNKEEAEGEDYKEILAYIAQKIVDDDIDDYEILISEKGNTVKLKDFDPSAILKCSKKPRIESDNNTDDDDDDDKNDKRSRGRNSSREEISRPRFVYTPQTTKQDYIGIGLRLGDAISSRGNKNDQTNM